jgi:hypothetical protein
MDCQAPRKVTVLVDDREKVPLLFPDEICWHPQRTSSTDDQVIQVKTSRQRLEDGDYYLEDYPDYCRIERKYSNAELTNNFLTRDYRRARYAFERFSESCIYPYLLLDMSLAKLIPATHHRYEADGELLLDNVFALCHRLGIRPISFGAMNTKRTRLLGGKTLVHLMLSHALRRNLLTVA